MGRTGAQDLIQSRPLEFIVTYFVSLLVHQSSKLIQQYYKNWQCLCKIGKYVWAMLVLTCNRQDAAPPPNILKPHAQPQRRLINGLIELLIATHEDIGGYRTHAAMLGGTENTREFQVRSIEKRANLQ
jgi:hypothetical protein